MAIFDLSKSAARGEDAAARHKGARIMRVTHNKAGTPRCRARDAAHAFATACAYTRTYTHADVCVHTRQGKGGEPRRGYLAQQARGAPTQKVHCIYKSFIMNYTMVYLKWEACLVHGYMGYRDYNACGGGREGTERERFETTRGRADPARNRTIACRCSLACVRPTCAHAHTITRAHASTN